jgi:DNA polymerase-3 subunit alpha
VSRGLVHLHTHTELSLFDGCGKQADFVKKAKKLGCAALGLTEHGSMRGVLRQKKTCDELGVKPIYGIEFYLCEDLDKKGLAPEHEKRIRESVSGRKERNEAVYQEEVRLGMRDRFHLTALAKTDEGLRNLFRLSSIAWIRGNYKKPRIDWAALEKHREGLIILSGCLSGPVAKPILDNKPAEALERVEQLQDWFGEDFYLEVMPHSLPKQIKANKGLVRIARALKMPLVATQDAHWVGPEDRRAQDALLCIHTRDVLSNPERFQFESDDFYLKGRREMERSFAEHHGYFAADEVCRSLDATLEIAEKVTADLRTDKFAALLPSIELPGDFSDEFAFLQHLALEGWERRDIVRRAAELAAKRGESEGEVYQRYVRQLRHELKTIRERKIVRYFLVVWDLYQFVRAEKIGAGGGRGSAAGSLVLYLLGITDLDPIERGLMFDRFIAPGRIDLPDIDCDFESRHRDKILDYFRRKYGEDRVAQIATINVMAGKGCLRDLGRVLEIPIGEINPVANAIVVLKKGDERVHATIEDAFAESKVCQEFNERYPEVLDLAKKLEGQARVLGVHASGVVVSPVPLMDICPLETRTPKGGQPVVVTAVDMWGVQELGLLKFDILAVRNLDAIKDCENAIAARHKVPLDLSGIDLEDEKVLDNFTALNFSGIFQFDTHAMRSLCQGVKFESFEDVVTMTALDRPGTGQSGLAAEFVKRKKDPKARVPVHPVIDEICADTLGVMVYQEHVLKIAQAVAGYTPEDADKLRKLIGKSFGKQTMAKETDKFVEGAVARGFDRKFAERLVEQIAFFGGYGFNKAHAASYGLTSYRQMWLKTYYPLEYMWSLLCNEPDADNKARLVKEARRMGLTVRAPDVRVAGTSWTIDGDDLVGALSDLKGVGVKAVEAIIAARPFRTFVDFAARVNRKVVNRRVVTILLKAGALRELVPNEKWLYDSLDAIWDLVVAGKLDEVKRHLMDSFGSPDWTPEEAETMAIEVNPLSQDRSLETHQGFIEGLPVPWTPFGDDGFWEAPNAFLYGAIDDVKIGRAGEGDLAGVEYAYIVLEDREGKKVRIRLDGEVFQSFATVIKDATIIGAHCSINARYKSVRAHYVVDLLELERKVSGREQLTKFEALLTSEFHPVGPYSGQDLDELARRRGRCSAVGMVTHVFRKRDRKKQMMGFVGLQGFKGYLDLVCFSRQWGPLDGRLEPGQIVRARLTRSGSSTFLEGVADFLE